MITKQVRELTHDDIEKYVYVNQANGRVANGDLSLIIMQAASVTLHIGHYSVRGLSPDSEIQVAIE